MGMLELSTDASIEFVLKIQETCNINCSYCYMYNVGNELYKSLPQHASEEVFGSVAALVCGEFERRDPKAVRLILHGGEPMLFPVGKLEARLTAMFDQFRRRLNPSQLARITLSMQSNAMLVSDQWIAFLEKWKIRVGVSVDGPLEVHDRSRVDKRSRGTYERVARGISLLQEAERERRIPRVGALCVIDPFADGRRVYEHLCRDLGFRGIDFLLPFMNWSDCDEAKLAGVKRFLEDAFDAWVEHLQTTDVRVRLFDRALQSLCYEPPITRPGQTKTMRNLIVVVESDGTIMPEESLRPTYDERYTNLSVLTHGISDILENERMADSILDEYRLSEECDGCVLIGSCASGGTLGRIGSRFSSDVGPIRKSIYCEAFVSLYVRAAAALTSVGYRLPPDWLAYGDDADIGQVGIDVRGGRLVS